MLIHFCLSALAVTTSLGAARLDVTPPGMSVDTQPDAGKGALAVRLTAARLAFVTVQAVNLYVVRVETRRMPSDEPDGWVTLAETNSIVDVMTIQNGATALLGMTRVDTGRYAAVRLVVDPSRSSLTLKDGKTLPLTHSPDVAVNNPHAIPVALHGVVDVKPNAVTAVTLEVRVGDSFALRGSSAVREGMMFNPSATGECTHEALSLFGGPQTAPRRYTADPLD